MPVAARAHGGLCFGRGGGGCFRRDDAPVAGDSGKYQLGQPCGGGKENDLLYSSKWCHFDAEKKKKKSG